MSGKLLILGRKWRGVQWDSAQLGGDVIIDEDSSYATSTRVRFPQIDPP